MVSDEFEIKALERARLDRENEERARQGRELKPIPEFLMSEEELDLALEKNSIKQREFERERIRQGFSRDTPVVFVDSESEEDEDLEESEDSEEE